jgi:hypothetical protein
LVADDIRRLLDYIVRSFVLHDEMVEIDQDASAGEHGESIESDKRRAARRELDRADELASDFAKGMARAHDGIVVLDDRNPDENAIANALIYFLVRNNLAASRAVETEPGHYRYRVILDRERLREVADAAGVDLDQAVRRLAV